MAYRPFKFGDSQMSNLLLDEKPLVILPKLAELVGLNQAVILQQIHYWSKRLDNMREGHKWVYNSIQDWAKQFPFWSEKTTERAFTKLRLEGLLVTGEFNNNPTDRTLWYRINYDQLEETLRAANERAASRQIAIVHPDKLTDS